jgi:enamine deaminase RidA (YjgF/YER057c/UK114 family)
MTKVKAGIWSAAMKNTTNAIQAVLPEGWKRAKGFSYGMYGAGRTPLYVAGQLAVVRGEAAPAAELTFSEQFDLSLRNVVEVVAAAGGGATDLASLRIFVTDMAAFKSAKVEIAESWRKILGLHFPPMTLVEVTALFEATAFIEIEAVALLQKED